MILYEFYGMEGIHKFLKEIMEVNSKSVIENKIKVFNDTKDCYINTIKILEEEIEILKNLVNKVEVIE